MPIFLFIPLITNMRKY